MCIGITGLRILGAGALIAYLFAATVAATSPVAREQDAAPQEEKQDEKKGTAKKDEKADRLDTKAAPLTRLNVDVKADGAPLADALVLVKQASGFERQSSTNSAGMAHFSQVPRGKTTVQVTAPGFKPHTREQDLPGGEVNLAIVLEKQ